jgi:hypothetical protein
MPGASDTFEKPWIIERTARDTVAVAANLLALCAYPKRKHLQIGGLAHRFRDAQLAWIARGAKKEGKISRLPSWVPLMQQQRKPLEQGVLRLRDRHMAHLLFCEMLFAHSNLKGDTLKALIGIRFSSDFSRSTISLSVGTGSRVRTESDYLDSVQAAIRHHLLAFGMEKSDEADAIKNIRNRRLYEYLRVSPVFFVVHDAAMKLAATLDPGHPEPYLILIEAPSWADDAIERAQRFEPLIIALAHQVGMTWFGEKNLIRVRERRNRADC